MIPPELPPARPSTAATFVDLTAKLSLVLGVLSVAWCLFQLLLVCLPGRDGILQKMQDEGLPIPAWVHWLNDYALLLTLAMLLISLGFVVVCWGMLKRRNWGRIGFIAFLLLVALGNFAFVPMLDGLFNQLQTVFPPEFLASAQGAEVRMQLMASRWTTLITLIVSSLVIAVLHGWLAIKLQRRDVRALFH